MGIDDEEVTPLSGTDKEPNDPGSGAPGVRRRLTMSNHGQPGVPCKHLLGAPAAEYCWEGRSDEEA
jgi:hypothetical protein